MYDMPACKEPAFGALDSCQYAVSQPADLLLYRSSAEKRRRLSLGHSPVTPVKTDSKPESSDRTDLSQAELHNSESPVLHLSDCEEDVQTDAQLAAETRIKVQQSLCANGSCSMELTPSLLTGSQARAATHQSTAKHCCTGSC